MTFANDVIGYLTNKEASTVLYRNFISYNRACLGVNAFKSRPNSPIIGTSQKIDFAFILPMDRS